MASEVVKCNKVKTSIAATFSPQAASNPYKTWHGDKGGQYSNLTPFSDYICSFHARHHENVTKTLQPQSITFTPVKQEP